MTATAAFSTDLLPQAGDATTSASRDQVYDWSRPQWLSEPTAQLTDVTHLERRTAWFIQALRTLSHLQKLERDWDTYQSDAPNELAVQLTRDVLRKLLDEDFEPSSLNPSSDGGVCLSFRNANRYGDIECFNSGEVMAVISDAGRDTIVWELANLPSDIPRAVNRIRAFLRK